MVASTLMQFLDRPGTAPAVVRPGILAGLDGRAGGTWLGVNRHGMIAAVTNRFNLRAPLSPPPPPPGAPAALVLAAVLAERHRRAVLRLQGVSAEPPRSW